ncbi:O-antigen ligase family protein [Sphingomonas sp. PAMC 26605]|uniref:O-antigen ligase family protein n=1 Tax=Sphingomonas sp. PAMC 26605 TaxID=1112214 RepID=UPI00026CDD4B|nr:O-antigen ligase family protein [Sphingomonas sp. PAMC 26605]
MKRHALAPAYLLACLLLGGASAAGFLANLALQLAALPLIGWALWRLSVGGVPRQFRAPLGLLAALVAVMLLQLVPLPPAIWTMLPGRGPVVQGYRLLDLPLPWLPLTLTPSGALSDLLWLLPAFAAFLTVTVVGAFRGRSIAAVIVGVTLVSVALGAMQVVGGRSVYFYDVTNVGVAVGFFANGNHNATLMLTCIPFLAALQATLLRASRSRRSVSALHLLVAAAYCVIAVGLVINASLAGIGLGVPVALTTWLTFGRQRPAVRRLLLAVTIAGTLATLVLIATGPFGNNLFGRQTQNVALSRQTSFALTARAASQYLPVGSGSGSFQSVYRTQEPLSSVTTTFMNHAHSDWLELLLETGLVGSVLAALFVAWWSARVRANWRVDLPDPFAQAAAIASAAILLHSIVDYPLRTAAISAMFAMCLALLAGARPYLRPSRSAASARHLTL